MWGFLRPTLLRPNTESVSDRSPRAKRFTDRSIQRKMYGQHCIPNLTPNSQLIVSC